jgi:hypothetical protein
VEDTSSPLHGSLDLTRLAAAGHSRGAKLAALQLAGKRAAPPTTPHCLAAA